MRRLSLLLIAWLCLAMAPDDVARHKEWMDTAQDVKDDLKDALDAKLGPKVMEQAAKLAEICKLEEAYWKKAGQKDAIDLAQKNRAAAEQIATAAKAGHFDQALQAYGNLEATCRACHDLHPEKQQAASTAK
jgi:cytochrome c556